MLVYPTRAVEDFAVGGRDVDSDVDWERGFFCARKESEEEGGG